MRRYKITEYLDGHCTVNIKEGPWSFWQKQWNSSGWDEYEETYSSRAKAEEWVRKDQAWLGIKQVTRHP